VGGLKSLLIIQSFLRKHLPTLSLKCRYYVSGIIYWQQSMKYDRREGIVLGV